MHFLFQYQIGRRIVYNVVSTTLRRSSRHETLEEAYQLLFQKTQPALTIFASVAAAFGIVEFSGVKHLQLPVTEVAYTLVIISSLVLGAKAWALPARGNLSLKSFIGIIVLVGLLLPGILLVLMWMVEILIVGRDHLYSALSTLQISPPNLYLGLIVAPLAETFIFQAWLQTRIGLLASVAIFFVSHWTASITILSLAISLGVVRSRTRSLLAVYACHLLFNSVMYVAANVLAHRLPLH
ncbi:MAG: hypothetical protein M3Z24_01690 [Chloroflexota bacterium]|nr:hypothetical protein [Chloroflexota bacterium]